MSSSVLGVEREAARTMRAQVDCAAFNGTMKLVAMSTPRLSYLICATQRTGSTLLCRALSATGVAGHPEEYFLTGDPSFFPPDWKFWEESPLANAHDVTDRRGYLEVVYDVGSTDNDVFGAKLMWNYLPDVLDRFRALPEFTALSRAQVLATAFPDAQLVLLTRRDRVRQAVSWARAGLTGVYIVSDTEPAPATADPSPPNSTPSCTRWSTRTFSPGTRRQCAV